MGILNALILISVIVFVGAVASVTFTALNLISSLSVGDLRHQVLGDTIEISMPVNLTNGGVLPISDVLVKLKVSDSSGTMALEGKSDNITLFPRESKSLLLNVKMNLSQMSGDRVALMMTENRDFVITASVQGAIQPFAKVSVAVNGTLEWEPPYGGLRIGEPVVQAYNATHLLVQIPISFKNRSSFHLRGDASVLMMDGQKCVGYGQTFLDVEPSQEFSGVLDVKLEVPWAAGPDPELLTRDLQKNYNVTLKLFAPLVGEFTIMQNRTINWGAPLSDLILSKPSVTLYNDTHVKVLVPITFRDEFVMMIEGGLQMVFYDSAGNLISKSLELPFKVEPGQRYVGAAIGYIPKAALAQPVRIEIQLKTSYGVVERSVELGV